MLFVREQTLQLYVHSIIELNVAKLQEGAVVQSVISNPSLVWGVGPLFAALTGVAFKEGMCYGKAEAAALFFVTPALLLVRPACPHTMTSTSSTPSCSQVPPGVACEFAPSSDARASVASCLESVLQGHLTGWIPMLGQQALLVSFVIIFGVFAGRKVSGPTLQTHTM